MKFRLCELKNLKNLEFKDEDSHSNMMLSFIYKIHYHVMHIFSLYVQIISLSFYCKLFKVIALLVTRFIYEYFCYKIYVIVAFYGKRNLIYLHNCQFKIFMSITITAKFKTLTYELNKSPT